MTNKHNKHHNTKEVTPNSVMCDKTEPTNDTMSDAINNALNSTTYLNALTKAMLIKGGGHAKLSDMINAINNAKESIAYKQSVIYSGYMAKTDITDTQKIKKRVWGWAKYYSQQGRFDLNKETGDITSVKGGY